MLTLAASATLGMGLAAAAWPLLQALEPSADVRAAALVHVDLSDLREAYPIEVKWRLIPVVIFRRTPGELKALLRTTTASAMQDGDGIRENLGYVRNWHRSIDPAIMVMMRPCSHEGCPVIRRDNWRKNGESAFQCPCCGSAFDLAGRILYGPAPGKLSVPPHRYHGAVNLVIGGPQANPLNFSSYRS